MTLVNKRSSGFGRGVGKYHELLSGNVNGDLVTTPLGSYELWKNAPLGSVHLYEGADGESRLYVKVKDDGTTNDWYVPSGHGIIAQSISYDDFTDGGSTSGTLVLDATIPAGAVVERCELWDLVKFDGDTSAVIQVGDGTDVDRYNTGTPDVFQTVGYLSLGAVSGTAYHSSAVSTVTVTITTASDFSSVNAGSAVVVIEYRMLA